MTLPERKSQTLERAILKFNEDLSKLQTNHVKISSKILDLSTSLLNSEPEKKVEITQEIEDLQYEMENNILLNIEIVYESIGGFEINLVDIDSYIPYIKEEQELLKDLQLSAKNFVKTSSIPDETLNKQERDNLGFLNDSYKKIAQKTQETLKAINKILNEQLQKVKKMENI